VTKMGHLQFLVQRLIIAGGFAVAVAAPTVAVVAAAPAEVPAQLANCPGGEEVDTFTGPCVPFLVPNSTSGEASPASATGTTPGGSTLCPPGVSGAECTTSSGDEAQPQMQAPAQGQSPEQQLVDVNTPDY
jgi:hypothetical protein